jgi:hypothetical protein
VKSSRKVLLLVLGLSLVPGGWALADFTPKFRLRLTNQKAGANPGVKIHLEFDEKDEEIGAFSMRIPAGFKVASDKQVPDDDVIGGGEITIEAGVGCRPGPEGDIPATAPVTVAATMYERARTDEEQDQGVDSVWFLDLEPLNRVRLLVSGGPQSGWTVEGAPTPSDNTCNPLSVDLTIAAKSESGAWILKNPDKPGPKTFKATIASQDSPAIKTFKKTVRIKK